MILPVFEWVPIDVNTVLSAEVTRGTFVVKNENNEIVWGHENFEWSWVEVLEWLTLAWDSLHTPGSANNPDNDLCSGLMGVSMPNGFIIWWDGGEDGYFKVGDKIMASPAAEWEHFLIQLGNLVSYRLNLVSDSRSKIVLKDWEDIVHSWESNSRLPILSL